MVPKLGLKLFPVVFDVFQSLLLVPSYSLALLNPLFPGVPELSVVIYVVKNASRLKSVALQPNQGREAFRVLACPYCNSDEVIMQGFFAGRAPQMLEQYSKK